MKKNVPTKNFFSKNNTYSAKITKNKCDVLTITVTIIMYQLFVTFDVLVACIKLSSLQKVLNGFLVDKEACEIQGGSKK